MLLYLPIRIYMCQKEFRLRKLFLTPHAIVYKNEKYVILPSVSDVIVERVTCIT
jgi:hypothetical protein